jgi:hypothetical protein
MKKSFILNSLTLIAFAQLLIIANFACSIKPPDDDSDLGAEVSANDIENAKASALAGYTFTQAFHKKDDGSFQVVDSVMGNSSLRDAYEETVTDMKPGIAYVTEIDATTGAVINGAITEAQWTKMQSSFSTRMFKFFAALPQPFSSSLSQTFLNVSHFVLSFHIEKTQALGENVKPLKRAPIFKNPLEPRLEKNISALLGAGLAQKDLNSSGDLNPAPAATPTATPAATPAPTPAPVNTSKYYKLQVLKHQIVTANCSQIRDCKVNSTRLDYIEIRKINGPNQTVQDARLHWTIELSTEVPGLFVYQQQCFSTVISQGTQQIPLTECASVNNFTFGGGS